MLICMVNSIIFGVCLFLLHFVYFNVHFPIAGAMHAGQGNSQVRNFISELKLSMMSKSCYQRHLRKVWIIFRDVAEVSCIII